MDIKDGKPKDWTHTDAFSSCPIYADCSIKEEVKKVKKKKKKK